MTRLFLCFVFALVAPFAYGADPVAFVTGLTAHVSAWQLSSGAVAVVLEFIFRLLPTSTPLSWAWIVSGLLHASSQFVEAVAKWLDSVLPQKTK